MSLDEPDRDVLMISVGDLDAELDQLEHSIADMIVPPGIDPFDAAALKCPGPSFCLIFLSNRKKCTRMFPQNSFARQSLKTVFTAEEAGSYSLCHFLVLLVSPD